VLGLLCEGQTHGWSLVRALRPEGEIGRVWSCSRPLVYRAIEVLAAEGLVEKHGSEESRSGPSRTLVAAAPAGRRALDRWLRTPVRHPRDVRSELMLKLVLHDRLGRDPRGLVRAQRQAFAPLRESLEAQVAAAAAFDRTLALWRATNVEAALRFLGELEADGREARPGAGRSSGQ
jgi:DNA-binding PadR family transcriptional regulator